MSNNIKIAISGKSGCGNTTVGRLVAEKLGFTVINYTFRIMAQEQGIDFKAMCSLAEKDDSYDKKLDKRQVELASQGNCVLSSRLAIWILEDADVKVYLEASLPERAARIAKREGGSIKQRLKETRIRDYRDQARYKRIYNIDNNKYQFADIIIPTDNLTAEQVAELIVREARALQKKEK